MAQEVCTDTLRKYIVSLSPVHENSLRVLLNSFSEVDYTAGQFFTQSGEYASSLAFLCRGAMHAYYSDLRGKKHVHDIFAPHDFILPLPTFINRKPSSLNFQAISECRLLQMRFAEIDSLAKKHSSVREFLRVLIDREWIIKKSVLESSFYFYSLKTRYNLLKDRLGDELPNVPAESLASYLRISEKQLEKLNT